jgi:hypothetical protein
MNEELILCAWCQKTLVSANEGYCSKKCHDDDKKANEQ